MPNVKHMKWWGWGVEGVGFHHENKPGFRPFVINAIDLDVNTPPTAPVSIDDLPIPAPMISDQLLAELTDAVGTENAVQDDLDRTVHTYGKSARDLLRIRAGDLPRVPDVVVYPGDEAEVQLIVDRAVAADAVIIPYGGGSNISGSLHAPEDETRPVISVDLGRLNQVI
ncbi:MAG: FAD-binding oxidoreductase, partial [Propionibacteriaceae bacterium]